MKIFLIFLVCVLILVGCTSNQTFTGQVDVKLKVNGKLGENDAEFSEYKQKDIDDVRLKLINELGPRAKVNKEYDNSESGTQSLPFMILSKARVEDLKILEKSDLVEFFYSDEPKEIRNGLYGRPEVGYPRFQWSYSKNYGYHLGQPDWGANAKKFEPNLIYQIYESDGRNTPKEIIEEWNKYTGKSNSK